MSIWDLLWLFFVISALQPVLQRKLLEWRRLRLLTLLERRRGTRVIALIHRQETMSLLGFPLMCYVNIDDSEALLRAINSPTRTTRSTHRPYPRRVGAGGRADCVCAPLPSGQGYRIRATLSYVRRHAHRPGGGRDRRARPGRPPTGQAPAASILNVLGQKEPKDIDDHTLICADVARKAIT